MPKPIEPPTPWAEQLPEWQALLGRIRQGDRSEVVAWDEATDAQPAATYQILVAGSVVGIVAVLRVDPIEASMIFRRRRVGDAGWMASFGAAQGLLTYWVLQAERIVILLDLTWAA